MHKKTDTTIPRNAAEHAASPRWNYDPAADPCPIARANREEDARAGRIGAPTPAHWHPSDRPRDGYGALPERRAC